MQNHIINVSKTTKIIICFFSFFLFSIVLFGIVIADHTKHEKLKNINGRAGMHYSYFSKNKNDLFLKLNIPEKGEYYITGECFESSYYLAYMVVVIDIRPAALCRRIIIKEDGSHDRELNYGNKKTCG